MAMRGSPDWSSVLLGTILGSGPLTMCTGRRSWRRITAPLPLPLPPLVPMASCALASIWDTRSM